MAPARVPDRPPQRLARRSGRRPRERRRSGGAVGAGATLSPPRLAGVCTRLGRAVAAVWHGARRRSSAAWPALPDAMPPPPATWTPSTAATAPRWPSWRWARHRRLGLVRRRRTGRPRRRRRAACRHRQRRADRSRSCCSSPPAHMLRKAPVPEARGRVIVGIAALTICVLGLLDIWAGDAGALHGRQHAGGVARRARRRAAEPRAVRAARRAGAVADRHLRLARRDRDADQRDPRLVPQPVRPPSGRRAAPEPEPVESPRRRRSRTLAEAEAALAADAVTELVPDLPLDALDTEIVPKPRKPRQPRKAVEEDAAADQRADAARARRRRRAVHAALAEGPRRRARRTSSTPRPTTRSSPRCSRCSPSSTSTARSPVSTAARRSRATRSSSARA